MKNTEPCACPMKNSAFQALGSCRLWEFHHGMWVGWPRQPDRADFRSCGAMARFQEYNHQQGMIENKATKHGTRWYFNDSLIVQQDIIFQMGYGIPHWYSQWFSNDTPILSSDIPMIFHWDMIIQWYFHNIPMGRHGKCSNPGASCCLMISGASWEAFAQATGASMAGLGMPALWLGQSYRAHKKR